jgi:anthranilate 1,2-dioxygenase large subunit
LGVFYDIGGGFGEEVEMDTHQLTWPKEGNSRVPYSVFSDAGIYRAELDRVFLGPTWQFLALEGELPKVGDYKTTFLGETPIIVARGEDGQLHAMVNRCAHRGNLVCLKRQGNADLLTCVYHSWSYDLQGNLKSVAFRRGIAGKGGMPDEFRLEDHGLQKLRTDHFGGLVFGTLSPDTPPLSEYIGNMVGGRIGRVLHGKPKVLGTTSQILHNNWKLYLENVRDTYHASLLHTFFTTFRVARLTSGGGVLIAENGRAHASYTRTKDETVGREGSDKLYAGIQSQREGLHLEDTRLLEQVSEFGDDITVQILSVFPNFVLQQVNNSIALRLVLPKGPDKTELQWTFLGFEEDDQAMNELRLLQSNLVGPAGYVSMEDGAVGGFVQRAIVGAERENSVIEMGGYDHVSEETRTTEASIRGFWQAYRPLMGY